MGAHHARVIAAHPRCRLVAAVDRDAERAQRTASAHGAEARDTVPDGVEAVVIATPTSSHAQLVRHALAADLWVLVEKPIFAAAGEAEAALAGVPTDKLVVAHVERFNPAVRALGARRPVAVQAERLVVPSARNRDIDTARDLLVHDLDLALWWGQGEPRIEHAQVGAETVEVRLDIDGLQAQLVASRAALQPRRRCLVTTASGERLVLDYLGGRCTHEGTGEALRPPDPDDGLTAQWRAFVEAVRGERPVAVDPRAAVAALKLAEQIGAWQAAAPTPGVGLPSAAGLP